MASIFNVTLAVNLIENLYFIYFYLPVCVYVSVLMPCVEDRDQFVGVGSLRSVPGTKLRPSDSCRAFCWPSTYGLLSLSRVDFFFF